MGTRVHSILEAYLGDGTAPDRTERLVLDGRTYLPGQTALSMVPYLPPAGSVPKEQLEVHFAEKVGPYDFTGYIDLLLENRVYDHKTTSDMVYTKTALDLATDPQALIYLDVTGLNQGQWTYGKTVGKPAAKAVQFSLTSAKIESALAEHVLPQAEGILKARSTVTDWLSLPPTWSACSTFGGCPHVSLCKPTAKERFKAIMSAESIIARLRAKKAAEKAQAEGGQPAAVAEVAAPALDKVAPTKPPASAGAGSINPPEAPTGAQAIAPAPEQAPVETAPKAKRGRPAGSKNLPKVEESPLAPDGSAKEVPPGEPDNRPHTIPGKMELFIDCQPLNRQVMHFHELIAPAIATVSEEMEVPHWGLVDFGKGAGLIAAQLKENLEAAPFGGALVVDSHTPEGRACLQVLLEAAGSVVKGL